jgi:hypothetical protein
MSEKKESIPLDKLRDLKNVLLEINESLTKAIDDYEAAKITDTHVKNWTTLQRGLVYVTRTVKQICGPTSKIQTTDLTILELPSSLKSKRKAEKAEDMAKLNEAAEKVREIRTRKPKSP